MRKTIITTLLISIFLSGCFPNRLPDTYDFKNKGCEIERIELLHNPDWPYSRPLDEFIFLRELEAEEFAPFMEAIYAIPTKLTITPPPTGYGEYVARVVYENGDVELFGSWHIEFVEYGDSPSEIGEYVFSGDAIDDVFFEYVGKTGDGLREPK